MAEVDPNIILASRPVELPNPLAIATQAATLRDLSLRAQANQVSLEQNQRALQDKKTIADLYRANTNPDGTVNHTGVMQGMANAGFGDMIPAYQQQVAGVQEAQNKASLTGTQVDAAKFDTLKKHFDYADGVLGSLSAKPDLNQNDILGAIHGLVDQGAVAPQQGAQMVNQVPRSDDPNVLRSFLQQKHLALMDAKDRFAALTPKLSQMDLGGTTQLVDENPLTRGKAPTTFDRTITPDQQAKVDLQREKGVFNSDQADLLAALASKGISLPAGMRSKEQQIATLKGLIEKYPGMAPDDIADAIGRGQINFGSDKKAATVAAAQEGKVSTAVNELSAFGDQALAASAKVPRTSFVPANILMQMAEGSISDPNLLTLKLKLNALNNAYNVLSARGGTDKDSRAHVQQLFSAANSPEGVVALVKGLKEEAAGAKSSAADASHIAAPPAKTGTRPPLDAILGPKGGG